MIVGILHFNNSGLKGKWLNFAIEVVAFFMRE